MYSTLALHIGSTVRVRYKNWRGEVAIRTILIQGSPYWGTTTWHTEPCWLIAGHDIEKNEDRLWAIADMSPEREEV